MYKPSDLDKKIMQINAKLSIAGMHLGYKRVGSIREMPRFRLSIFDTKTGQLVRENLIIGTRAQVTSYLKFFNKIAAIGGK